MKFYLEQHSFYCGIDLHAKTLHACVIDQNGKNSFTETSLVGMRTDSLSG